MAKTGEMCFEHYQYVPDFVGTVEALVVISGFGNGILKITIAAYISCTPADANARTIVVWNKGVASRDTVLESIHVDSGQVTPRILGIALDHIRLSVGVDILSSIEGGTWETESRRVDRSGRPSGRLLNPSSTT